MFLNNLVKVDNVLLDKEIADSYFACDLSICKGACCTLESDFGAPLLKEEIGKIEEILPVVKKYLSTDHVLEIENKGFFEEKDDEILIKSVDRKACVFVYYENDIAKCSIEKAYLNKETDFKKPVSCHLFPIRVSNFGGDVLRYERFSECKPAISNGKEKGIKLIDFCSEPLQRTYGKKWYSKLKKMFRKEYVNS
ncbi:MAG: DUF3109 family protein [Ignavibacteriaceae bacterium]